ncbi:MAG: hypothetical protein IJT82_03540 [Schwartzia sp.]|nr:hypothetical protein [Schwartzia sp. (in: firmicutes)]
MISVDEFVIEDMRPGWERSLNERIKKMFDGMVRHVFINGEKYDADEAIIKGEVIKVISLQGVLDVRMPRNKAIWITSNEEGVHINVRPKGEHEH